MSDRAKAAGSPGTRSNSGGSRLRPDAVAWLTHSRFLSERHSQVIRPQPR